MMYVHEVNYLKSLLANPANRIVIVSGEGERGTVESYAGRRTMLAIKRKLRRETRETPRWAYAVIEDHNLAPGCGIRWDGGDTDRIDYVTFPVRMHACRKAAI